MKQIIILLCVCFISALGQDMDKVQACIDRVQPSKEDIESVMSLSEIPSTDGAKCLMGCAMKQLEMTNPDNTINVAGSKAVFEVLYADTLAKQLEAVFNDCAIETKDQPGMDNECSSAKVIAECLIPKAKPIFAADSDS